MAVNNQKKKKLYKVVGVATVVPTDGQVLSLDDSRISKIYYMEIGAHRYGLSVVPFKTPDYFSQSNHQEIDDSFVNVFFSKARFKGPTGDTELVIKPRAGAEVPFFVDTETMLQISGTHDSELHTLVYVSKDLGMAELSYEVLQCQIDGKLIKIISGNNKPKVMSKTEFERFHRNLNIELNRLSSEVLNKFLSDIKEEDRCTIEQTAEDKLHEQVYQAYMSLYLSNKPEQKVTKGLFDTLCLKHQSLDFGNITEEEITEASKLILLSFKFDKTDLLMDHVVISDHLSYLSKNAKNLSVVQQHLVQVFKTLSLECAKVKNEDTAERTERGFKGSEISQCGNVCLEGEKGHTSDSGASEGKENGGQVTRTEGAREGCLRSANNSDNSAEFSQTKDTIQSSNADASNSSDLELDQSDISELIKEYRRKKEEETEAEEDFDFSSADTRSLSGAINAHLENKAADLNTKLEAHNNCIPNCPICHGAGYVLSKSGFKTVCPNKQKQSDRKADIEQKITAEIRKDCTKAAVTRGLIPKGYVDKVWGESNLDTIRRLAKENGLTFNPSALQEYNRVLTGILTGLFFGKLPEISYFISSPNGSGKSTFVYTVMKVLISHCMKVVPYASLIEIAEQYKYYLRFIGNTSRAELEAILTEDDYDFEDLDNLKNTKKISRNELEAYRHMLRKTQYRYKDYLDAPLLMCSMSQDKVSLPVEMSTLKTLLSYRSRSGKPTIVFSELMPSVLPYEFSVGEAHDGLFTMVTRDQDLATLDRLFLCELKPVRKSFIS